MKRAWLGVGVVIAGKGRGGKKVRGGGGGSVEEGEGRAGRRRVSVKGKE